MRTKARLVSHTNNLLCDLCHTQACGPDQATPFRLSSASKVQIKRISMYRCQDCGGNRSESALSHIKSESMQAIIIDIVPTTLSKGVKGKDVLVIKLLI